MSYIDLTIPFMQDLLNDKNFKTRFLIFINHLAIYNSKNDYIGKHSVPQLQLSFDT